MGVSMTGILSPLLIVCKTLTYIHIYKPWIPRTCNGYNYITYLFEVSALKLLRLDKENRLSTKVFSKQQQFRYSNFDGEMTFPCQL